MQPDQESNNVADPQNAALGSAPAVDSAVDSAVPVPSSAPQTPPVAWASYVGHIVRWEDGTSWYVKENGRHWIADGGTYQALEQKGAQVFNLPAPELDKIPDIKGSKATA